MQRLIVTSATYRQSSRITRDCGARSGEPYVGARPALPASRRLIPANALSVSGLLNPDRRPQRFTLSTQGPLGRDAPAKDIPADFTWSGKDLYRRSMYTIWKRTVPPPALITFDAPDRRVCGRRSITNTPLQALVLLNDPTYVEASRFLAARMLTEARLRRRGSILHSGSPPAASPIRRNTPYCLSKRRTRWPNTAHTAMKPGNCFRSERQIPTRSSTRKNSPPGRRSLGDFEPRRNDYERITNNSFIVSWDTSMNSSWRATRNTRVKCVIFAAVFFGISTLRAGAQAKPIGSLPDYRDTSLPIEKRVDDLVSRMTLDEKVRQMQRTAPEIPRLGVPVLRLVERSAAWRRARGVCHGFPASHRHGGHMGSDLDPRRRPKSLPPKAGPIQQGADARAITEFTSDSISGRRTSTSFATRAGAGARKPMAKIPF